MLPQSVGRPLRATVYLYSVWIIKKFSQSVRLQELNILLKNVGVRRLELPTSTSRTWRAANCATPRLAFSVQIYKLFFIYPYFYYFF